MSESRYDRIEWDRLQIFYAVAEAGSFSQAGRKLKLSQSAISRQVCALEEELKTPLFHRHARGLALTEQGDEFYRAVKDMSNRLDEAVSRVAEAQRQPQGPLKITTTVTFGSAWLTSRINLFHLQYPEISVSLVLSDGLELDLSAREADAAIRFAPQTHPRLIERKLMKVHYHLFAGPQYLAKRGVPRSIDDLAEHELIVYGDETPMPVENMNWILTHGMPMGQQRRAALRVNSVYAIYRAVRSGLGIGALPYYVAEDGPGVEIILPEVTGPSFDVFFVYAEERRWSKRIMVLRDFLLGQIEKEPPMQCCAKSAGRSALSAKVDDGHAVDA
jgi:DNA-binding transcriptional LysR family regulator